MRKVRQLTGLSKYMHLMKAVTGNFLSLPPAFVFFMMRQMRFEKPTVIGNELFINTTYAPLRSKAHKTALKYFADASRKDIHPLSVNISITGKCIFTCQYCSNIGSVEEDLDGKTLLRLIGQIQDSGAACIGLTGGEPLLRYDIEKIVAAVDERSFPLIFTSGYSLDRAKARALKSAGLSAIVISLDSHIPEEHNFRRNFDKAYDIAVAAIESSLAAGLYTAISMVISKEMLASANIHDFVSFVGECGAHEIRLLRPMPCGKLMTKDFELFGEADLNRVRALQYEINRKKGLPKIMALPHIGSINNYGCSAGRAHVYVTSGGDVCPCDFVPLSFGNVREEPFHELYNKMLLHFPKPAYGCISQLIYKDISRAAGGQLPVRDMAEIQQLIGALKDRPTPLLYKKLGYD